MQGFILTAGGVMLASGFGLGWGWVAGRAFTRPFAQDLTAALVGWFLGSTVPMAVVLGGLVLTQSWAQGSGVGFASAGAGTSETVLIGLPIVILLAVGSRLTRRRLGRPAVMPIILGGVAALVGAFLVATTITVSAS